MIEALLSGLAIVLIAAYRWAGVRLAGGFEQSDRTEARILGLRRYAPAGAVVVVCLLAALGAARCSR